MEGCDSTTELLPPSRPVCPSLRRAGPRLPTTVRPKRSSCGVPLPSAPAQLNGWGGWPASRSPSTECASSRGDGRRLVARGGFEPPKPLGRQIYSLLRLTAPQPRRCFDRHTTANSCQMLAETEVARFMNPTAFGRRCIPHARRLASRSAGSNAAGMLLPRALRGRRLDALGASPYS